MRAGCVSSVFGQRADHALVVLVELLPLLARAQQRLERAERLDEAPVEVERRVEALRRRVDVAQLVAVDLAQREPHPLGPLRVLLERGHREHLLEHLGRLRALPRLAVEHVERVHHLERVRLDAVRRQVGVDGHVRVGQLLRAPASPSSTPASYLASPSSTSEQLLAVLGGLLELLGRLGQPHHRAQRRLVAGVDGQRLLEVVLRAVGLRAVSTCRSPSVQ